MGDLTFDQRLVGCVHCGAPLAAFDVVEVPGATLRYEGCARCGLVQMNPRPSDEALASWYATTYRIAQRDEEAQSSAEQQRQRSANLRDLVGRQPRRHLDIGCSAGILLATFGAADQVGVEPGEQHRALAVAAGVTVFESIDDLIASSPAPFDLISISHVLEHLAEPVEELGRLRSLLTDDGLLVIEVPNLYGHRTYEPSHLLAFTLDSLSGLLATAGFRVERSLLHKVPHGGSGAPKAISVVAAPVAPLDPPAGPVDLGAMHRRRRLGMLPQELERRWNRQVRRLRRWGRGRFRQR